MRCDDQEMASRETVFPMRRLRVRHPPDQGCRDGAQQAVIAHVVLHDASDDLDQTGAFSQRSPAPVGDRAIPPGMANDDEVEKHNGEARLNLPTGRRCGA